MASSSSSSSDTDLPDNSLEAYNNWRQAQGLPVQPARLTKRSHMYKLSDEAVKGLDMMARQQGFTYWGGGSISGLLEALGQGYFKLEANK